MGEEKEITLEKNGGNEEHVSEHYKKEMYVSKDSFHPYCLNFLPTLKH